LIVELGLSEISFLLVFKEQLRDWANIVEHWHAEDALKQGKVFSGNLINSSMEGM